MRRFLLRLAWLAIFLCVPVQTAALAAEPAKPLTVQAVFEGQLPLAGMRFNVYRVAGRSGGGTWSLEPRFKAYQTRLETQNGDGEAWAALARVLEKVTLMEEACLPDVSAETDEDGTAVLDALRPGLYLLSGQSVCVNRQIYTPSPMLIVCPAECAAEPELTRSPEKARALLRSPCPLSDVYKEFQNRETEHMDTIRDSIETEADKNLQRQEKKQQRESR